MKYPIDLNIVGGVIIIINESSQKGKRVQFKTNGKCEEISSGKINGSPELAFCSRTATSATPIATSNKNC